MNSVFDWLEKLDQIVEMPDFLECQTFRRFGSYGAARDTTRQYGLSEAEFLRFLQAQIGLGHLTHFARQTNFTEIGGP